MLRFIISFVICLAVCALSGWGLITAFPEAAQAQGLLLGLLAGILGSLAFWLTFGALLAFTDLD